MATHSSTLAWRISWTEEPGGAKVPWGHKELSGFTFFVSFFFGSVLTALQIHRAFLCFVFSLSLITLKTPSP